MAKQGNFAAASRELGVGQGGGAPGDRHLEGLTRASCDAFRLAACAAALALFYAGAYVPPRRSGPTLADYFERLMAHASVARTVVLLPQGLIAIDLLGIESGWSCSVRAFMALPGSGPAL